MSHWNYRIIDFGTHYALYEVFYDDEGTPYAYTETPATFGCELADELGGIRDSLDNALKDVDRFETLPVSVFGEDTDVRSDVHS